MTASVIEHTKLSNGCVIMYIMYDSTASCLCNDASNKAVQTICSGPSTAPCVCNGDSCMVSINVIHVHSVACGYHMCAMLQTVV